MTPSDSSHGNVTQGQAARGWKHPPQRVGQAAGLKPRGCRGQGQAVSRQLPATTLGTGTASMGRCNSSSDPTCATGMCTPPCPLTSKHVTTQLRRLLHSTPSVPAAMASPCHRQRQACDASPAITTGRAVLLQQTSPLSPATNQGQAAALLDRACRYVLLLLMSSLTRSTGTQRRATWCDSALAPLPIQGSAARPSCSPVAVPAPGQGRQC